VPDFTAYCWRFARKLLIVNSIETDKAGLSWIRNCPVNS